MPRLQVVSGIWPAVSPCQGCRISYPGRVFFGHATHLPHSLVVQSIHVVLETCVCVCIRKVLCSSDVCVLHIAFVVVSRMALSRRVLCCDEKPVIKFSVWKAIPSASYPEASACTHMVMVTHLGGLRFEAL